MEFRDVESINKEVIVQIKDVISLKDLLSHMDKFGFTLMTIQGIEAEIKNHGEAYAAMKFLDAVNKKPSFFPRFIAALRYTHQLDVYNIFMEQIGKYFTRQDDRLAKILSLISNAERKLGIVEDHDDGGDDDNGGGDGNGHGDGNGRGDGNVRGQKSSSSGNHRSSPGLSAKSMTSPSTNDYQQSIDINRRDQGENNKLQPENPANKISEPATPNVSRTNATSSSSSSLDNVSPGATGNTRQRPESVSPSCNVDALDPEFADDPISDLKANVHRMLGKALEKINMHDDDDEPWWNYIINNGDLDVSRREQKEIENDKRPGSAFLDILGKRDYTLQHLEQLFIQFQIYEALDILRQHQNKVIRRNTPSRPRDNNLNRNQATKADSSKTMNISITQTDAPPGSPVEHGSPPDQSVPRLNSCASNQSVENNTDYYLPTIEDVPIKGTQAIQACGDSTGSWSQPSPETDAEKLRNDRLNQFETDPQALENTSFHDVHASGGNNIVIHDREDDDKRRQVEEEQEERDDSVQGQGEIPTDSVSQSELSGNLPYLSGLQSVRLDSSSPLQMRLENPEPPQAQVTNIPPRSLTSFEKNVLQTADGNQVTGVNLVPPSIESEHSRETNMEGEYSTGELTGGELNVQSMLSENDETTASLTENDVFQGTLSELESDSNVESKPEDSKNIM